MSTYAIGHSAEERAARYLKRLGFTITQLNWRTRYCEIDIVAQRQGRVYFVEVKYRSSGKWGNAYDYVTNKKMSQMRFAASLWLASHKWTGAACLAAVSIDGSVFRLELIND